MISVLCPSRGRPTFARELLESMRATSVLKFVELVLRLDDDDPFLGEYLDQVTGTDVKTIVGPRVVLSQCWNEAAAKALNDIMMLCGDDIRFRTHGWDNHVAAAIYSVPDRIVLVHGRDGIQDAKVATHPFLHRRWIETVGYFVPPLFASDWNDMWLTEVADLIGRRRYLDYVYTEHLHPAAGKYYLDQTHLDRLARHRWYDCDRIYRDTVLERRADADKLRAVLTPIEESVMTQNPDQNQPAPTPDPSPSAVENPAQTQTPAPAQDLGPTDSPTPEQRQAAEQADAGTELKGEALDKALEDKGLPKTGTADEKRARLADDQG